ncbi:MAG: type II secretion system F family protein [Clostridia bacterium]|nr:type II secretion system F family protein [Clostridia bacterium]
MEESTAMTKKIRNILVPNLIQFGAIFLLLILGTALGVPMIQSVFDKVGSTDELPAITLWFSDVLDLVAKYWVFPTVILVAAIIWILFYIRTPRGKFRFHNFKYRMPLFGNLIYAIDFSRFIQAVLMNIKNGQRIQDALETSKNAVHNLVMLSLVESAINNILIGRSWIEPFEKSGLSTPMITEMLKIGMQSDIQDMMEKLLEYMQIDIDNIIQKIMKVLPQIVYSIVGVMLIFLTVVVLVPMIQVYMGTWMFSAYGM